MFGPIGMPELIIIFTLALIIFGPRKLPELGKSLGRTLSEFKRASNEIKSTLEEEIRIEEQREAAKPAPVTTTTAAEPVPAAGPATVSRGGDLNAVGTTRDHSA